MAELTETDRIAKLESQIEKLKQGLSQVSSASQSSIADVQSELNRVSKSWGDNIAKISNLSTENSDKVAELQKKILGDGEQEPGLKTDLEKVKTDVNELKLESRDRLTRNNFVRGAWAVAGTLIFGLGVTLFRGTIDEKAANAAKTQTGNEQKFSAIEEKMDKHNKNFYDAIAVLNANRAKVDESLEWIKQKIK